MRYIGLDVHYGTSTYCVLDENGRELQCETVRGHWPKLLERLKTVAGRWTICFEATCDYGYLYRELSRLAERVVVAHPGHVRLIFRAKRKNDRIDARKLAKLLYLDEVPAAYVPSQEVQSWRELIEHRRHMMDRQTTCKNAIRSLLRGARQDRSQRAVDEERIGVAPPGGDAHDRGPPQTRLAAR